MTVEKKKSIRFQFYKNLQYLNSVCVYSSDSIQSVSRDWFILK